ncbi:exosortase A [Aquabacterium lacunae]|uniref:Exosortase A n=1 Tax=Aquabacterium lacunae TaxID=2528630 RepID=A0A4Q9H3H4_9BURK|nr:exosortase A [Aquabacterium lacunae]TBO30244.1 exosortase A [Aquabacterium lacunae]
MNPQTLPARWRLAWAGIGLVWVLVLLTWLPTALSMVDIWERSETYAHGFVVPPLCLWLIWRARQQWQSLSPLPAFSAVVPMALIALAWLAGELVSVNALRQFALVAMMVMAVPLVGGWALARALTFPLCFVFLCVPFGDFLLPWLMNRTADFTVLAVRASGVPVYREGLQFVIPSGSWSVVEACSGIRYLVASVMAGCLYGYLNYTSMRLRVRFLVLSVAVALIANWLRAYLIVMLGHYSGNTIATGVDHLIYGWVFFGFVLLLLFWLGGRWHDPASVTSAGAGQPQALPIAAVPWRLRGAVAVMLAAMALALPWAWLTHVRDSLSTEPVLLAAPAAMGAGRAPDGRWEPDYRGARASVHRVYPVDQGEVGLHLAYYRRQGGDSKLISAENRLAQNEDPMWSVSAERARQVPWREGFVTLKESEVMERHLAPGASRKGLRVWQLFWLNGQIEVRPAHAKLLGGWQLLRGQGDDGAIITLYTQDDAEAVARLTRFARAHDAQIDAALLATQGQR